jgi:hypothetical protein
MCGMHADQVGDTREVDRLRELFVKDLSCLPKPPRRISVARAINPGGLNQHLECECLDRKRNNRIPHTGLSKYPEGQMGYHPGFDISRAVQNSRDLAYRRKSFRSYLDN